MPGTLELPEPAHLPKSIKNEYEYYNWQPFLHNPTQPIQLESPAIYPPILGMHCSPSFRSGVLIQ